MNVVRERTSFDGSLPLRAQQALDVARSSPGASWNPEGLALAEEAYRQGVAELRREETRFFLFRDLRLPARTLALSEVRSVEAERVGRERMGQGRSNALAVLAELSRAMEILDELETRASLPRAPRAGLAGARMGLVEASTLLEAGAYRDAEARGRDALGRARNATEALGEAFLRFADEERIRTWNQWIAETVAWSRSTGKVALVVVKERNLVVVYEAGRRIRSYPADMGSNNLAQKYRQGDRATPEGRYRVQTVKDRGRTQYYRAFLLDYPTPADLRRIQAAKEEGIIPPGAGPGALIEIHGEGGRGEDWTNGCVALANPHMDELFGLVKVGTPVTIVGGDGSAGSFSSLAERLRGER